MPKMRNKRIVGPDHVMHVSWEPDRDHDAWMDWATGTPPTRETHPDAFYRVVKPAYPVPAARSTRQTPPGNLSRTQMRKRLSRTGLAGAELRRTLDVILAGPTLAHFERPRSNRLAFGWDIRHLANAIGEKLTRKLLRFVRTIFVVRDEYWDMAKSLAPLSRLFEQARSVGAEARSVAQDTQQLANLADAPAPC